MSDVILGVEDVSKSFGGVAAVNGASFEVRRSSITALIGPNGAGKSTLFSAITGFERADAGRVRFEGDEIQRWSPYRIARRGLVRTFQLTRTFAGMTVLDNVLVGYPRHRGGPLTGALLRQRARRADEADARRRAHEALSVFGLESKANQIANELSGGQRKLLELARALMLEPTLVLLDEPMAGVNRSLGGRLLEHIQKLREERGTTFLFVEHDMDIVVEHSDHVIVMADGRVVTSGPAASVMRDEAVVSAYLGEA